MTEIRPKAFLWDFDGTIADSEPIWIRGQVELSARFDLDWSEYDAWSMVGETIEETTERALATARGQAPSTDEYNRALFDYVKEHLSTPPFPFRPGVESLLSKIKDTGIPVIIVSSSHREILQVAVESMPDGFITAIVSGDEVPARKPDPAPFLKASAIAGVEPEWWCAVEDSPTGSLAASNAGMTAIVVPDLKEVDAAPQRVVIPTFDGVTLDQVCRLWAEARAY